MSTRSRAHRRTADRTHRHDTARYALATVQAPDLGRTLTSSMRCPSVLDGIYAHLPLKRSLYGVRRHPGSRASAPADPTMTDLQFHRELTLLINRLRDAHTQYQGPWTVNGPGRESAVPGRSLRPGRTTHVCRVEGRPPLGPRSAFRRRRHDHGLERDSVRSRGRLHAESETGGRPDARRARALESLTFRSLEYAPPPNEQWVVVGYSDLKHKTARGPAGLGGPRSPRAPAASHTRATRIRRAINPAAEAVRRAKKFRFNHALWRAERGRDRNVAAAAADAFADFLTARTVTTRHGRFGYLRIWSFDVDDDQAFLNAAIALFVSCPTAG